MNEFISGVEPETPSQQKNCAHARGVRTVLPNEMIVQVIRIAFCGLANASNMQESCDFKK